MRVLWVGFGQAGGKLVDTIMATDSKTYEGIAINTEQADLGGLQRIKEQLLIGKYILKGRGVGSDIDLAASVTEKALSQIMDQIDPMVRRFDPEAFWIAAGLAAALGIAA